jgi:transcriptional regulator with XRE-family HTH domain
MDPFMCEAALQPGSCRANRTLSFFVGAAGMLFLEQPAMKKLPSAVDHHIGARLRTRRIQIGLSQEKLGDALGITFQQIQKYEKGANRMGASRLQQAAVALGVPVSYFYEDLPGGPPSALQVAETAGIIGLSCDETSLVAAFRRVNDPKLRKRVQQLVEAMGAEHGEP